MGFVQYSLAALAFIGTSFLIGFLAAGRQNPNRAEFFGSGLTLLSLLHAFVLIGVPLKWIVVIHLLIGLPAFGMAWKTGGVRYLGARIHPAVFLATLWAGVPFFKCLFEGINRWDPRSIFFFHSKIIYFAGQFPFDTWTLPDFAFAHMDYPKLTACLAALLSTQIGFWNEYWPKLACGSLLLLLQWGIFSLPFKIWTRFGLQVALFSVPGFYLWVGEQDGYLAGFTFLAVLYLGIGLRQANTSLARTGLLCLGVAAQLKNEGLVLALLIASASLALSPKRTWKAARSYLCAIAILPTFIWTFLRWFLGVQNDLVAALDRGRVFRRLLSWQDFWSHFLHAYFIKTTIGWALCALFLVALYLKIRGQRLKTDNAVAIPLIVCMGYSGVLTFTYLSTHWVLLDHLNSSIARVALAPSLLLVAAGLLQFLRQHE